MTDVTLSPSTPITNGAIVAASNPLPVTVIGPVTATAITIGTTTVTGGGVGDLLTVSAGPLLDNIAAVATGRVLVSAGTTTKPVWSATPALTSLALGGATIGTDALGVTGTVSISGNTTLGSGAQLLWSTDLIVTRAGAANLRFGAAAVDTAPVAQTLSVQNTLAGGTSDVAGAAFVIAGSQGKGTGVGGYVEIKAAPAGSTGTAVNALVSQARFGPDTGVVLGFGTASFSPYIQFLTGAPGVGSGIASFVRSGNNIQIREGNNGLISFTSYYGITTGGFGGDIGIGKGSAIATTATGGFLLLPGGAGPPTGVPVNAGAGKNVLYVDESNSQLYLYIGGSWKQPKTPAGAATVTWQ